MDNIIKQDCLEYLEKIDLSPLVGKTVYITGANGLIGTYLIYMLHLSNISRQAGIKIVAVSKSPPSDRLKDIFISDGAYTGDNEFHSADLACVNSPLPGPRADYVIHGATYAQPGKFLRNYLDTIHLNTVVTEKLLEKAKSDGSSFLFLSSSEIYGDPDDANIPTPEDYPGYCPPVGIRAIYSESKRMGETLCFAYRHFDSVDAKIARISMTYGPGIGFSDERVLGQFIRQALLEKRITMIDDGSKVRTFCYIADCVLMLFNILLYGKEFVYNVGGLDSISIRKLAESICSITGSELEIPVSPETKDISVSPKQVRLDIKKVCSEFSLPPFKPFGEGLRRTVEWNRLQMRNLSGPGQ